MRSSEDWRRAVLARQSLFFDVLYLLAPLRGATLFNLGYAPLDPALARSRQAYQLQTYELCLAEIRRLAPGARRLIEVGAGLGAGARHLERRHGVEVRALEPSRMARLIAPLASGKRLSPGRAPRLPAADASLDGVFSIDATIHFFGAAFLAEARRALRPGGALAIADFRKRPFADTRALFETELRRAGFEEVAVANATANVLAASDADAERRRLLIRGLPSGLRRQMAYSICCPDSGKYREFVEDARSYAIAVGRAPGAGATARS